MLDILEKIIAVSKDIGPPPKRYAIIASTVKGSRGMSDYDKFAQLPQESIGMGSACPIIPSPFGITKTIQKTKRFKRLNREPKIKTKNVQVPAIMLVNMSTLEPPKFTSPIFTQETMKHRYGIY